MEPIARDIQHFSHGQHYFRGAGGGQEGVGGKTLRAFGFPVKWRMARAGMTFRVGGKEGGEGIEGGDHFRFRHADTRSVHSTKSTLRADNN